MKIHAAAPVIIGLALILSAPVVSKIVYAQPLAQARMEPSNNGVPVLNPMMPGSTVYSTSLDEGFRQLGQSLAHVYRTCTRGDQSYMFIESVFLSNLCLRFSLL
jgi:hypothetical protein